MQTSHCKGLSPTRLPPTSSTNLKSQVANCTSDQSFINQGFPQPLLGFNNLLKWFTKLRETPYLHSPVYYEGQNSETTRWKTYIWQGMRYEAVWNFQALSGHITLPEPQSVHQSGSSLNPFGKGIFMDKGIFMEASLLRHD